MAAAVPTIQSGSLGAPVTVTVTTPRRQMLVENNDTTNSFTVAWNGSGGSWTLKNGDRLGILLVGGVTTVTLTAVAGAPTFQILLQG